MHSAMDHSSPAQPQPAPAPASLAVPRLWNRIASDYLRDVAPGLALFAEDALRLGGVVTGCRCADVACGPGDLSLAMARAGAEVASLDFSDEMVALLRARANREGLARIEARVGDGMALPWSSASFDVACWVEIQSGRPLIALLDSTNRRKRSHERNKLRRGGVNA